MIIAALFCLQLVNTPNTEVEAYEARITPEVRVVQKVAPTVVFITTEGVQQVQDFWGFISVQKRQGSGSGVVIHQDGYIVTNYHVVRNANKDGIRVTFDPSGGDERVYPAQLISAEPAEDLALLKIESDTPFQSIVLGTSADLMIAERVLAFGNPYGQTHTVSRGIISGLHREVTVSQTETFSELIQTDAAINPGNSGGPLVNINGELIGINTVMNTQAQNMGFAIPVDAIRRVLQEKLLSPSNARAWLGFDVDLKSFKVKNVLVGSPAKLAGLEEGDKIIRFGPKPITTEQEYRFARLELASNQDIEIEVERANQKQVLKMQSWTLMRGLVFKRIGLEVENFRIHTGYNRIMQCLRVSAVRESSPATELGILEGDILTTMTPKGQRPIPIRSDSDLALLVNALPPGTEVEVDLWRDIDENGLFERNDEFSELFQGPLKLE